MALKREGRVILLEALTPLHPGAGRGAGHVDLPVQRDEFGFPAVWATSLKGALKSTLLLSCDALSGELDRVACRRRVLLVFGPETDEAHEYASAVSFLDARLVAIPARSLRGVWTYVTSPHLLQYLLRYLEAAGRSAAGELGKLLEEVKQAAAGGGAVASTDRVLVGDNAVLNEMALPAKTHDAAVRLASLFPGEVGKLVGEQGLVVVGNDVVGEVVRRSLLVQTRVRLDYRRKTVASGGLWEEEYVPQFTIFTTVLFCTGVKAAKERAETFAENDVKKIKLQVASEEERRKIEAEIKEELQKKYIEMISTLERPDAVCKEVFKAGDGSQIRSLVFGGKETVGKGLASVVTWET
jgi:CRISPR-associated protein Cmr4